MHPSAGTARVLAAALVLAATAGCGAAGTVAAADPEALVRTPQDLRPTNFPAGGRSPTALASGDFDGDGHADVAVALMNGNGVGVLLADGRGGFAASERIRVGGDTISIVASDLDSDGDLDLAAGLEHRSFVAVLLGDGRGTFAAAPDVPTSVGLLRGIARELATADLDADGLPELLAGLGGTPDVAVVGSGLRLRAVTKHAWESVLADVDGDGRLDLVTTDIAAGRVGVLAGVQQASGAAVEVRVVAGR